MATRKDVYKRQGMDTEALEGIVSAIDLRADTSGTQADSGGEAGTGQSGEDVYKRQV